MCEFQKEADIALAGILWNTQIHDYEVTAVNSKDDKEILVDAKYTVAEAVWWSMWSIIGNTQASSVPATDRVS
jgi:hypothetical protein